MVMVSFKKNPESKRNLWKLDYFEWILSFCVGDKCVKRMGCVIRRLFHTRCAGLCSNGEMVKWGRHWMRARGGNFKTATRGRFTFWLNFDANIFCLRYNFYREKFCRRFRRGNKAILLYDGMAGGETAWFAANLEVIYAITLIIFEAFVEGFMLYYIIIFFPSLISSTCTCCPG